MHSIASSVFPNLAVFRLEILISLNWLLVDAAQGAERSGAPLATRLARSSNLSKASSRCRLTSFNLQKFSAKTFAKLPLQAQTKLPNRTRTRGCEPKALRRLIRGLLPFACSPNRAIQFVNGSFADHFFYSQLLPPLPPLPDYRLLFLEPPNV